LDYFSVEFLRELIIECKMKKIILLMIVMFALITSSVNAVFGDLLETSQDLSIGPPVNRGGGGSII